MNRKPLWLGLILSGTVLLSGGWSAVQNPAPAAGTTTLAERLGYPADARLLIVHADDLGLSHSVNRATFDALRKGSVSSASIMVPCPWLHEVAEFARAEPQADLGLHLTLNAEWKLYKWGPVASRDRVSSLLDPLGFLLSSVPESLAKARPEEVELEVRAQIDLARRMGIEPTHLDSHMGTLFMKPEFLEVYLRVGREQRLPLLLPRRMMSMAPYAKDLIRPDDILIDDMKGLASGVPPEGWAQAYDRLLEGLQPGVTEMIVHLAYDDEEMQGVAWEHPDFGAGWRQRDLEYVQSERFRETLRRHRIQLITWREIGRLLR
ncbi:MAG: carbohydrate deacetylase [Acidobacteriota bacterium]